MSADKIRFRKWLQQQQSRNDCVGRLATHADNDPRAPRSASRFASYFRWNADVDAEIRAAAQRAVDEWKI